MPRGPVVVRDRDGRPLAWAMDPVHIRLYAWCLVNLHPIYNMRLDRERAAREVGATEEEIRWAIVRLVESGDIVQVWGRVQEFFRLTAYIKNIRKERGA